MRGVRIGITFAWMLPSLTACSLLTGLEDETELRWAELGRPCPEDAPAVPLSDLRRDSLPPPDDDLNGRWADLALRAPGGWGGYYIGDGPTMYMVDTTEVQAAASFLRDEGLSIPMSVVAKQGRWDFAQLYDWYRYLLPAVISVEGTYLADIQEARNRLEYGVADNEARGEVEEVLVGLGVPCYLVAIGL